MAERPKLEDFEHAIDWINAIDEHRDKYLFKGTKKKARQAKSVATDEFKQSMKKPGAVDKYAKQALQKDTVKRVKKEKLEKAIMDGVVSELKKGKAPYQEAAKGGYIKKYAKGGSVKKSWNY
jgi:hypothetical protein